MKGTQTHRHAETDTDTDTDADADADADTDADTDTDKARPCCVPLARASLDDLLDMLRMNLLSSFGTLHTITDRHDPLEP